MPGLLTLVRDDERRDTLWATVTIGLVLMAHAMIETARDALFLSHLPASQLPWVYLAIAVLALLASRALVPPAGRRGEVRQLIVLQLAATAGTVALLLVTRSKPPWALYALYIWGGLAASLIVIRFWLLLTNRLTIGQAKRLLPVIAAGPLLGSLLGFALAGLLCQVLPPGDLLGAAAGLFLLSAAGSLALRRAPAAQEAPEPVRPPDEATLRESVALALRHTYVRRVALLLLLASVTVTLGDFVFKSVAAREIGAGDLGTFFSVSYFAFDLIALGLLFTAVVPFVRSRGVSEALALQPILLLGGGVLFTVAGGLAAVLCLRGVDGALRWSLHKTATEMLYVPLSHRLRSAVKAMSDIVGHRGGQALASLLILGWIWLGPPERLMGLLLIGCACLWIYLALSLRQPYLDLFRDTLNPGAIATGLDFPDLDMASLETLVAALSSPDERRVTAAMYLLEHTERGHLIPALILYHPSVPVVLHALDLFAAARRDDAYPITEHLLRHPDTAVRAAAMRACASIRPDTGMLTRASESESPAVAATALVALAARGGADPGAVAARLEALCGDGGPEADELRRSVARALRHDPLPAFSTLLERLANAEDTETRRLAARAMGAARDERHLPVLIGLLPFRELREPVREALLAFGDAARDPLQRALADPSLPRRVRIHLPRTLSRFADQAAADLLLRHLLAEPSGTVRYKILRGLGRMITDRPELRLDAAHLDQVIERQVHSILQGLRWRIDLQRGLEQRPERGTVGHQLLVELLQQREGFALERLFRALGLRYPDRDLARIYDAIQGGDATARSGSRELLQGVLPPKFRRIVVALTEELPAAERLAAADGDRRADTLEYDRLLGELIGESSPIVSSLAFYHAAELGLADVHTPAEQREDEGDGWLAALRRRSLAMRNAARSPAAEVEHGA